MTIRQKYLDTLKEVGIPVAELRPGNVFNCPTCGRECHLDQQATSMYEFATQQVAERGNECFALGFGVRCQSCSTYFKVVEAESEFN